MSSLVKPDSAVISDIRLPERFNHVRLVKPDSAAISDSWFKTRDNHVRLVKVDSAAISDSWLPPRYKYSRLVANSSPVKLLILLWPARRDIKVAMYARVIGAAPITARSLASGISTST